MDSFNRMFEEFPPMPSSDISFGKPQKRKPKPKTKKGAGGKRVTTGCGFLLFSSESRPIVRQQDPSMGFGDLSKKIGELWRTLSAEERGKYDARAKEKALLEREAVEADLAVTPNQQQQPTPAFDRSTNRKHPMTAANEPTNSFEPNCKRPRFVGVTDPSQLPHGTRVFLHQNNRCEPYVFLRYNRPKIEFVNSELFCRPKLPYVDQPILNYANEHDDYSFYDLSNPNLCRKVSEGRCEGGSNCLMCNAKTGNDHESIRVLDTILEQVEFQVDQRAENLR